MSENEKDKPKVASDVLQDELTKFGVDISVKTKDGDEKSLSGWEKLDEIAEKDFEKLDPIEKELMKHSEEVGMNLEAEKHTQKAFDEKSSTNGQDEPKNDTEVQPNADKFAEAETVFLDKLNMLLAVKKENNPMMTFVERGGRMSYVEAMTLPEDDVELYHQAYDFYQRYNQAMLCYAISVNPYQYAMNLLKTIGYQ